MIPLSGGFTPIPEGVHVFKITAVEYKKDFGKLLVTMETKTGKRHIERYSLLDGKGSPNPAAMNAFSYFAKTAMNDYDLEEIDEEELVGHYIQATVEHKVVESNKTPGKMLTFVQLGDKEPADGFEGEEPEAEEEFVQADDSAVDDLLKGLLG